MDWCTPTSVPTPSPIEEITASDYGKICGCDTSQNIEQCRFTLTERESECVELVGTVGGQPATAMVVYEDDDDDVVARDGGKGDLDHDTNGRVQVNGLKSSTYRVYVEGDDVDPDAAWSVERKEKCRQLPPETPCPTNDGDAGSGDDSSDDSWPKWTWFLLGMAGMCVAGAILALCLYPAPKQHTTSV